MSAAHSLPAPAHYSRFVQRVRRRHGPDLPLLAPGLPDAASLNALLTALGQRGDGLARALRLVRQWVLERLATLDVEQGLPLESVCSCMTTLAEVVLEHALAQACADEDQRSGAPLNGAGQRIDFWILGMGKLGARELNVSSDIDLIYVYAEDGQTAGPAAISAHEYFARVARRLYALVGDTTEDGLVFRVDLALRPNGNSGPPAVSLAMLEEYFLVQGREWERLAWLKSRVVAPRAGVAGGRALALRSLVTPFVYRRYLDYGVFESLRQLHQKIREQAQRRAAGRPERANDVKLSRGGIREIEFIVQLLQVVRAGQYPELRTRSTLRALQRLSQHGLMSTADADALAQAYQFLRRLEHRIQYLDDQQTHLLPTDDADLAWIAASLGLADTRQLLDQLGQVRERVAGEFDALLHDGRDPAAPCNGCTAAVPALDSAQLLQALPAALVEPVQRWMAQPRVQALRDQARERLARLVQRSAELVNNGQADAQAVQRLLDWLNPLLRRDSYLALLVERQEVLQRLLRLLGLARWPMHYLMRHPGVIDELADPRLLHERFDRAAFSAELRERHAAWQRAGQAEEDALMDAVRHAHHAEVFRTLVRDVEGLISTEQVADDLSALADCVMQCVLDWTWLNLKSRHRASARFAVIAYGKLGGLELGYGSDLDVVFLYDDADEVDADRAQEVYGAYVRKLVTWLTLRTPAGELFDIDTALRPNGNSGLLVTSIAAFERYQTGRGSNTAWTWEHQAITRARFCAGTPDLAARFEAVRRRVLAAPRDAPALRAEVASMRDKVRRARPVKAGLFDVKHSAGGMMDAEFAVQYLVLAHGEQVPPLLDNAGNIALLQRAEAAGLLPAGVGQAAASAYRQLRQRQHRARLDEQATQFAVAACTAERDAVLALWSAVFA